MKFCLTTISIMFLCIPMRAYPASNSQSCILPGFVLEDSNWGKMTVTMSGSNIVELVSCASVNLAGQTYAAIYGRAIIPGMKMRYTAADGWRAGIALEADKWLWLQNPKQGICENLSEVFCAWWLDTRIQSAEPTGILGIHIQSTIPYSFRSDVEWLAVPELIPVY